MRRWYLLYFAFISRFNNNSVGGEFSLNTNEMVESLSKDIKMC